MQLNILRPMSAIVVGLFAAAGPVPAQACWLFNCFGHHNRTTFYAPVAAAPACNTCAPQTVNYVPQTAYRPLLTMTPYTAMRPVTTTNPCTGCPTTVMHPTTSYMQRTVMMPYTTYRPVTQTSYYAPAVGAPVIGAPACPTGACGVAPTTSYYQPSIAPVAQPGCCGTNSAPVTMGVPMSRTTTTTQPLTSAPLYNPNTVSPPRTFGNASQSPSDAKSNSLKPVPEAQENGTSSEATPLKLLDPQNRTTFSLPAGAYTPVAWKDKSARERTSINVQKLDDSGWEAAR